jgi:hypothetical protein
MYGLSSAQGVGSMTIPTKFHRSRDTSIEAAEIRLMPAAQKKEFILELMNEFGISRIRQRDPEIQHNCTVGLGGHSDNNSYSASVNYETLKFNCYVCGMAGSVIWWIAVNRGIDVDQVTPWVKQKLGIGSSLPLHDILRVLDAIGNPEQEHRIMPQYPERILNRWTDWNIQHPLLTDPPNWVGGKNIGGAGIPEANLNALKWGYADYDEDFNYHDRIIIPMWWDKHLVGWQARATDPDSDPQYEIKYKNSPDFPRDSILYGAIDESEIVLCESPKSVVRHMHHAPMVCTLGAKVTPRQLRLLERYRKITILNENDKAGWSMIRRVSNALARKVIINVAENPYSKEYDAMDMSDGIVEDLVSSAVPASIWTPKRYREQIPLS